MKSLVKKIKKVTKSLLDMAYRADEAVSLSLKSLFEKDKELARKIIANDDKIDILENQVDRMCLNIFALNQPVAIDLRSVLGISKIDTDFERIGDLACVISEKALDIMKAKSFDIFPEEKIRELGKLVQENLKDTIEAYINEDANLSRDVIFKDSDVNRVHDDILKDIIKKANEDAENFQYYIDIVDIIKSLERIGDRACNVCEDIIFIETGEIVKHTKF